MELHIYQSVEPNPTRFRVRCALELDQRERNWMSRYGAPPLTESPIMTDSHQIIRSALFSVEQIKNLTVPVGVSTEFPDVRLALAFVADVKAECEALADYWGAARSFESESSFPVSSDPK